MFYYSHLHFIQMHKRPLSISIIKGICWEVITVWLALGTKHGSMYEKIMIKNEYLYI